MQVFATGVQSFRWEASKKLENVENKVPLWEPAKNGILGELKRK
jgi:hypothetical protein